MASIEVYYNKISYGMYYQGVEAIRVAEIGAATVSWMNRQIACVFPTLEPTFWKKFAGVVLGHSCGTYSLIFGIAWWFMGRACVGVGEELIQGAKRWKELGFWR